MRHQFGKPTVWQSLRKPCILFFFFRKMFNGCCIGIKIIWTISALQRSPIFFSFFVGYNKTSLARTMLKTANQYPSPALQTTQCSMMLWCNCSFPSFAYFRMESSTNIGSLCSMSDLISSAYNKWSFIEPKRSNPLLMIALCVFSSARYFVFVCRLPSVIW